MNRVLPTGSEWLFSIRTFGAAMLALGIGLASGLDRPYWAMATVYIASQPLSGATRSKAVYRLMGTMLGATAAVVLVPNLVQSPEILSLAMAAWTACCLTLALLDRSPRSYVFMLAGYTAAIIGFPSVASPETVFATALARTEEIGLGIVCASLVASVFFPRHVGPVIAQRTERWLLDGRQWAVDVLEGRESPERACAARRQLAADAVELGTMATHLAYDPSLEQQSLRAVQVLHGRMLMLLPLLSSLSDRMAALRRAGGIAGPTQGLLTALSQWLRLGGASEAAGPLRARIEAAMPALDRNSGWDAILTSGLLMRLRELIDLRQDCRLLLAHIAAGSPGLPRALSGGDGARTGQHRDLAMALFSGLSAGIAVWLVCLFWIASAWPLGYVAAEMTAVACCFFAAQDNPVPAILNFLRWTVVAVLIDAVYLFAILPMVNGFEMLALVLAPAFLLFGVLAVRPATSLVGMALSANGATLLAIQESYNPDFASFVDSGIATVLGMVAAAVVTQVLRSIGAEIGLRRLSRAHWASLAKAAVGRGEVDRAAFAGLVLDRLGLAAPRLAAIDGQAVETAAEPAPTSGDALAELRIGLNIIDLRRARHTLPAAVAGRIDAALEGVADAFRAKIAAGADRPAAPALLDALDGAIHAVIDLSPTTGQRDALLGLVGLRRAMFPTAPGFGAQAAPALARDAA